MRVAPVLVASALLAGGCSRGGDRATPAPTGPAPCTDAMLTGTATGGVRVTGSSVLSLVTVRNTSATACRLIGYPTLSLLDEQKKTIGARSTARSGTTGSVVTLDPGAAAGVTFVTGSTELPSAAYCRPVGAASVRLTLGGDGGALALPLVLTVCSASNGLVTGPFRAGTDLQG